MDKTSFANGITAADLRTFLEYWPHLTSEWEDAWKELRNDKDIFFTDDAAPFAWCTLYELPIREHLTQTNAAIVQRLDGALSSEQVMDWQKQLAASPSQVGELPSINAKVGQHFDAMEDPSKEQAERLRLVQADIFGKGWSMFNSLRCVLYHGCFLNELIGRVRASDDKALFDAVRIDPTVVGCKPVIERISKATLLKDNNFFAKLKAAMNRRMAKREQANFQKMRLVLEILHEKGATRLNDKQLRQLFVEELQLYSGDNDKALRKFADTYMKKSTVT